MKESIVQKLAQIFLVELSKTVPITHWRMPVEKRVVNGVTIFNQLKGFSDILICYRGLFVSAEAKATKGKQRETQKAFQEKLENADGEYFIFRSLHELSANLKRIAETHLESEIAKKDSLLMDELIDDLCNRKQIKPYLDQSPKADVAFAPHNDKECRIPF